MVILDYDLLKDNENLFKPMISSKTMKKFWTESSKNCLLECMQKNGTSSTRMFPFTFFFLVQFEINLHLWVFQKAEIALVETKNSLVKKKYDYLYKIKLSEMSRNTSLNGEEHTKYKKLDFINIIIIFYKLRNHT